MSNNRATIVGIPILPQLRINNIFIALVFIAMRDMRRELRGHDGTGGASAEYAMRSPGWAMPRALPIPTYIWPQQRGWRVLTAGDGDGGFLIMTMA